MLALSPETERDLGGTGLSGDTIGQMLKELGIRTPEALRAFGEKLGVSGKRLAEVVRAQDSLDSSY